MCQSAQHQHWVNTHTTTPHVIHLNLEIAVLQKYAIWKQPCLWEKEWTLPLKFTVVAFWGCSTKFGCFV